MHTRTHHTIPSRSLPIRCCSWYSFPREVEAFIREYRVAQCHVRVIQPRIHRLAGGFEHLYRHLPGLSTTDLDDDLIEALLINQAGHLDITLRHYFRVLRHGSVSACDRSRAGLQRQLRLARYRFLNCTERPALRMAYHVEIEALRRYPICWELRKTLHDTLQICA